MKLTCNLQIVNRQMLAGRDITSRGKSQRGVLSIGKQSAKINELYLLVQTRSNSSGTKYRVKDNIESIFLKFVNEGKLTIRLKEPTIELNIKCDNVIELKSFLHVLKLGIEEKLHPSILPISNLNPKKMNPPGKRIVSVKSESHYPVLEGFPRTTEILYINGLNRKSFDRQILRLQSLTKLDISNNLLSSLPKDIGTLRHLRLLNLSHNQFGASQNISAWSWLNHPNIQKNLEVLDLSNNHMKYMPKEIGRLRKLVSLSLNDNELAELPFSIGMLKTLKTFNISNNFLTSLPGSMLKMCFEVLCIANNFQTNPPEINVDRISIPTLIEHAARVIVDKRLKYDGNSLPFTLSKYLNDVKFCTCGKSCFDVYISQIKRSDASNITSIIIAHMNGNSVPFIKVFCSHECMEL